jgi:hypothetical protein
MAIASLSLQSATYPQAINRLLWKNFAEQLTGFAVEPDVLRDLRSFASCASWLKGQPYFVRKSLIFLSRDFFRPGF